jgi:ParB/RepB/Spo0J family partition protein
MTEFSGTITRVEDPHETDPWIVVELDTAPGKAYAWAMSAFLSKLPREMGQAVGKRIRGEARPHHHYDFEVTALYEVTDAPLVTETIPADVPTEGLHLLDPGSIQSPTFSIRMEPEDSDLPELTETVRNVGVLETILVRPTAHGLERVTGGRRQRAAKAAGAKLPALVRRMSDAEAFEAQLIENLHRLELTDYEKGRALKEALTRFPDRFPTQEALAKRLGKGTTRDWVTKHVGAFEKAEALKKSPDVTRVTSPQEIERMSEFQLRELAKAPLEKRAEILERTAEVPIAGPHEKPLSARKLKRQALKAKGLEDIDTGVIWVCKICKHKFTHIHCADGKHKLEEVTVA